MAPGIWQILIVVVILVLLFGGRRIPGLMEDVALGIKSFKKGLKDDDEEKPKALESEAVEEKKE